MPSRVLTNRQLNRTFLHRQHLLKRSQAEPMDLVSALAGLQAQTSRDPFLALWSRLHQFEHDQLDDLLTSKRAVRASLMRGTIHLVTAADYKAFFPMTLPHHLHAFPRIAAGRQVPPEIVAEVVEAGRSLLRNTRLTTAEMGDALQPLWPAVPAHALGQVIRYYLPLIQPPPRGTWGTGGAATWMLAGEWLETPIPEKTLPPQALVQRYLAAFGPASVADFVAWSGLSAVRPVFDAIRADLVSYRSETGVELFDLPDQPILDGDEATPVRFLPGFDNALLGHKDRTRIIAESYRKAISSRNGLFASTFLVDGYVAGTWKFVDERMELQAFQDLTSTDRPSVESEAMLVARFWAGTEPEITWLQDVGR